MIALDSETTGVDFRHGTLPFFITTCDDNDEQINYEWSVDPYTRKPTIPIEDVEEIKTLLQLHANWGTGTYDEEIAERHTIVLHNAKFDVTALGHVDNWFIKNWPWKQTRDTIVAAHILDSTPGQLNLTDLSSRYLNQNIQPFEDRIEEATQKARRIARRKFPEWMIAKEGLECMPSQKSSGKKTEDKAWHADMWLPKALVVELGYDGVSRELEDNEHKWDELLADYANVDTFFTIRLWKVMRELLVTQDLWTIFQTKMKLPPIALKIEHRGITLSKKRLDAQQGEYERECTRAETICYNIASDYRDDKGQEFNLPKSGNNKHLVDFVFNHLKLPKIKETATGNASLDAQVIDEYVETLPPKSIGLLFIKNLSALRKREKALSAIEGYKRYWIPTNEYNDKGEQLWYRLHSNFNLTGTAHLRWSSDNPNAQNISKKEGFNLRYMFGPSEGREWWSLDAQNIELRLPAFESGEKDLIEVFLKPNEAPYFGSYHLVVFDTLYPDLFKKHGAECKEAHLYESTLYQWVKNGNFSLLYGAGKKKADATYHYEGAYELIRHRFPKMAQLSDRMISIANRTGGIETIPDRSVNPKRGYPVRCGFGNYGKVQPTLPLNYHISGSAGWWQGKSLIRTDERIEEWRSKEEFDAHIIMQVHDELVFDLPRSRDMLTKVISGGQTGVDQAGLRAAKCLAIPTGGYINKGYKTLEGSDESLSKYRLVEMDATDYPTRTKKNVQESDGTLRIASDFSSRGEQCTFNAINQYRKPHLNIHRDKPLDIRDVIKWIKNNGIRVLNVAGNSEQTSKGIGKFAEDYLTKVFVNMNENLSRVRELKELMEKGGDDFGIPTPVAIEYNALTWDTGIKVK